MPRKTKTPEPKPPPRLLPTPAQWAIVQSIALAAAKSGIKGCNAPGAAAVKILLGMEHGLTPAVSLQHFQIIDGNPTLSAVLQAAIIRRSPDHNIEIKTLSDTVVTVRAWRTADEAGARNFSLTIEEATVKGYTVTNRGVSKPAWLATPANMLLHRVITTIAKLFFPELALGALYIPDELDAEVDETGAAIETLPDLAISDNGTAIAGFPAPVPNPPPTPTDVICTHPAPTEPHQVAPAPAPPTTTSPPPSIPPPPPAVSSTPPLLPPNGATAVSAAPAISPPIPPRDPSDEAGYQPTPPASGALPSVPPVPPATISNVQPPVSSHAPTTPPLAASLAIIRTVTPDLVRLKIITTQSEWARRLAAIRPGIATIQNLTPDEAMILATQLTDLKQLYELAPPGFTLPPTGTALHMDAATLARFHTLLAAHHPSEPRPGAPPPSPVPQGNPL